MGQLTFFRVYSGVVNSGDTVLNSVKGKKNVSAVSCRCANERKEIKKFAQAISLPVSA